MDYDDHPDFNKARTAEESTQEFADDRQAQLDKTNADFNSGVKLGLMLTVIVGLLYIGLAPDILG